MIAKVTTCIVMYANKTTIPNTWRCEFTFDDGHRESYDLADYNVKYWKDNLGSNFVDENNLFTPAVVSTPAPTQPTTTTSTPTTQSSSDTTSTPAKKPTIQISASDAMTTKGT